MGYSSFPFTNAVLLNLGVKGTTTVFDKVLNFTSNWYRTGYVDYDIRLDAFLAHSRSGPRDGGILYHKGKNQLLRKMTGFFFQPSPGTREMHQYFQRLLSTGIYFIWDKWYHRKYLSEDQELIQTYKERLRAENSPKPLQMGTNMCTAFFIYLFCISLSLVLILYESKIQLYLILTEFRIFYVRLFRNLID